MRFDEIASREAFILNALSHPHKSKTWTKQRKELYRQQHSNDIKQFMYLECHKRHHLYENRLTKIQEQVLTFYRLVLSQDNENRCFQIEDSCERPIYNTDPLIGLVKDVYSIRDTIHLRLETPSHLFDVMHGLETFRQRLLSVFGSESRLKTQFDTESISVTALNTLSASKRQCQLKELFISLINSFFESILKKIQIELDEEAALRKSITDDYKSILSEIIRDQTDLESQMKDTENDVLRLMQKVDNIMLHKCVRIHRDQKESAIEGALRHQKMLDQVQKQKRKEEINKGRIRVAHRKTLFELRQKQKRIEAERQSVHEISRINKLKELASQAPYYETIKKVIPDIHKLTKARLNDVYQHPCESDLLPFQHGDKKLTSFKSEKLFSDPKFRLAHELHENGVASSKYSLNVFKYLVPRVAERTTGIEPY